MSIFLPQPSLAIAAVAKLLEAEDIGRLLDPEDEDAKFDRATCIDFITSAWLGSYDERQDASVDLVAYSFATLRGWQVHRQDRMNVCRDVSLQVLHKLDLWKVLVDVESCHHIGLNGHECCKGLTVGHVLDHAAMLMQTFARHLTCAGLP
jgi:hypothetical protein